VEVVLVDMHGIYLDSHHMNIEVMIDLHWRLAMVTVMMVVVVRAD
jgi:hypothetical protein